MTSDAVTNRWFPSPPIYDISTFSSGSVRTVVSPDLKLMGAARLKPLGNKVLAVVNDDNFSIAPGLMDTDVGMVQYLTENVYSYTWKKLKRIALPDRHQEIMR